MHTLVLFRIVTLPIPPLAIVCHMARSERERLKYKTDPEYRAKVLKQNRESAARAKAKGIVWKTGTGHATGYATSRYWRLYRYGVTPEQFEKMMSEQGGKCAICSRDITGPKKAHLDHCHTTGKVRGVLCIRCNRGISLFSDNKELLGAAIIYLQKQTG